LAERADEGLLRQVLRTLRVPHLAVEEADQVTVGRAVPVRPIDAHGCPIRPACETRPPGGSWTRCVVYSPGGPQRNAMPRPTGSRTGRGSPEAVACMGSAASRAASGGRTR